MYRTFSKRIFDLCIAIILLPFAVLTGVAAAVLIKLEDGGPVFYISERLGRHGICYRMVKFRTMKVGAEDVRNKDGSTYNAPDDSRLLRIGGFLRKTSIDEVPQIFNVLLGNMSIIGPRPDLPEHLALYTEEEKEKLTVLPGMTGFNQAYFRNSAEWAERKKNDVYYARNMNFLFDMKILMKTIVTVLGRDHVFIPTERR